MWDSDYHLLTKKYTNITEDQCKIRKPHYVEYAAFFVFEKNNVKIAVGHKCVTQQEKIGDWIKPRAGAGAGAGLQG